MLDSSSGHSAAVALSPGGEGQDSAKVLLWVDGRQGQWLHCGMGTTSIMAARQGTSCAVTVACWMVDALGGRCAGSWLRGKMQRFVQ